MQTSIFIVEEIKLYFRLNFYSDFSCISITSTLSATALMGLFFGFKFVIITLDLSLTIFPTHLLGLKALMGAIEIFLEFKFNIGPFTDKL